ncbi:DUF7878 domain-containing protein [Hymenobacter agri]
MLRFSFCFDEVPAELVYNETVAYYLLDGTLCLTHGPEIVWKEIALPLVEVAMWLSEWWACQQLPRAYTPDGAEPDSGPMLVFMPAEGNRHRLTYTWGDALIHWTAEQAEWGHAVKQFREEVRNIVLERYRVRLDRFLPLFPSSP